jgi:hypothetical protein
VCTKPGIRCFLNPTTDFEKTKVEYFNKLYEFSLDKDNVEYVIDKNNLYIPVSLTDDFLNFWSPTQEEHLLYIKTLIDTYPEKNVLLDSFVSTSKYKKHCHNNCWLYVENKFGRMCDLDLYSIEGIDGNTSTDIFISDRCRSKFDGVLCKHYSYCSKFECKLFHALSFDTCWKKEIYDYTRNK